MTRKEIKKIKDFHQVYTEFDKWLLSLGFRFATSFKESATYMDFDYSWYDKHIHSLYGVEHYVHDILKLSVRFLRDKNEHKFLFVGSAYTFSEVRTLDQAKEDVLKEVKMLKEHKLNELNEIINI